MINLKITEYNRPNGKRPIAVITLKGLQKLQEVKQFDFWAFGQQPQKLINKNGQVFRIKEIILEPVDVQLRENITRRKQLEIYNHNETLFDLKE